MVRGTLSRYQPDAVRQQPTAAPDYNSRRWCPRSVYDRRTPVAVRCSARAPALPQPKRAPAHRATLVPKRLAFGAMPAKRSRCRAAASSTAPADTRPCPAGIRHPAKRTRQEVAVIPATARINRTSAHRLQGVIYSNAQTDPETQRREASRFAARRRRYREQTLCRQRSVVNRLETDKQRLSA